MTDDGVTQVSEKASSAQGESAYNSLPELDKATALQLLQRMALIRHFEQTAYLRYL